MASLESVINGRFKLLERPVALPGKCACCGAVDRPVVDFGFDLDFYGVVYLCTTCLGEASEVAGSTNVEALVTPPPIDYEALNEFFRRISDAFSRIDSILPDSYFAGDPELASAESDAESSDGTIREPREDSDALPELTSVQGPNDSSGPSSSSFNF